MNRRRTTIVAGTLLAFLIVVSLVANAAIITTGLAGRWIFNEASGITAYDSSGFNDDGTLQGAALFAADAARGQVLLINGISGLVGIPYNSRLEPFSGTVSVWVKPALATTADIVQHRTETLLRCNKAVSAYAYGIRVYDTGMPMIQIANDDPKTCSKAPQIVVYGSSNQVPLGKWTHLAMRWDGLGALNLFVNGKLAGKSSYNPNPTKGLSYSGNASVGVGSSLGNFEYNGSISDLRIYSRALSNTEIANIALNQQ